MTDYKVICRESGWINQYKQLLSDGYGPEQIDRGYFQLKKKKVLREDATILERQQTGARDRVITCEEIAEITFAEYEKYNHVIRGITGYSVPWRWEKAENPALKGILQVAEGAIQAIRADLKRQGLTPESEEYKRMFFTGLYVFANTPRFQTLQWFKERDPGYFAYLLSGAWEQGLATLINHVETNGGLGLGFLEADRPIEGNADTTLLSEQGACTERSSVFYALCRLAGLNPRFFYLSAIDLAHQKRVTLNFPVHLTEKEILNGHVTVALPYKSGLYFVDFDNSGTPVMNVEYSNFGVELSLREFFHTYLSNLAIDMRDAPKNGDRILHTVAAMAGLGESSVSFLTHSSEVEIFQDQPEMLKDRVAKYLEANPQALLPYPLALKIKKEKALFQEIGERWKKFADVEPAGKRILQMLEEGGKDLKAEKTEEALQESIRENPLTAENYVQLFELYRKNGDFIQAETALLDLQGIARVDSKEHAQGSLFLAWLYLEWDKMKLARGYFGLLLEHPSFAAIPFGRLYGDLRPLIKEGEFRDSFIKKLQSISPPTANLDFLMALLLWENGDREGAKTSLRRGVETLLRYYNVGKKMKWEDIRPDITGSFVEVSHLIPRMPAELLSGGGHDLKPVLGWVQHNHQGK